MYCYQPENVITYTSADLVLFRESPFACWMERLTLENPAHGIPPDVGTSAPHNSMERQDEIADTLRSEGRDVALIDWNEQESRRREHTLDAMRSGTDFIVNGQLALGNLSGSANLLMRTSGYSELGDFIYIPCDTQAKTTLHSTFRLCFLSDLLHGLQGQLPPQMLIIRGGSDVVPLHSEDHIYHYRAVKLRFMDAMSNFRKHRMPDPAESSHFGRWADCANEVLKQRALRREQMGDEAGDTAAGGSGAVPIDEGAGGDATAHPAVAGAAPEQIAPGAARVLDAAQAATRNPMTSTMPAHSVRAETVRAGVAPTLAEQARMLDAGVYQRAIRDRRPAFTPNLAQLDDAVAAPPAGDSGTAARKRSTSDPALENLEFVGRSLRAPVISMDSAPDDDVPAAVVDTPASALQFEGVPATTAVAPGRGPSVGSESQPQGAAHASPAQPRTEVEPGEDGAADDDMPVPVGLPEDDAEPLFTADCEPPPPTLKPPPAHDGSHPAGGTQDPADTVEDERDYLEFGWRMRRAQQDWREQEEAASDSFDDVLITSDDYLSE
ncbi:MAG: hypothetical protein KDI01_00530 [Halioglobus sp.]|nr:hypothetical protein [Halioglobus sp.]